MASSTGVQDEVSSAAAPPALAEGDLRRLIAAGLDPLDASPRTLTYGSDRDLNPGLELLALAQGYEPAAVLIGLIERKAGLSVLFTRRADTLRRHAGQTAFPGGRSEAGETPWQTALREAHEEVGLLPDQVTLAGLSTPFRLQTGYHVTPVVGYIAADFEPRSNPDEVAEVFEAPMAFLMDPANYELGIRPVPGPPRRLYTLTYGGHVIWGATAAMLRTLYDRLREGADG